jgi:hypothetical protein
VTEVDQDLQLVDLADQLAPERAQPAVVGFETTVAHEIAAIVDGLDDANTESMEHGEPLQISVERARVLETVDQAHPAARLRSSEIARSEDLHEVIGMIHDLLLRVGDAGDRFLELVRAVADTVNREIHRRDARRLHIRQHGRRQACVRCEIRVVAARPAEPVDHDRLGVRLFREASFRCCGSGEWGGGQRGNRCRGQKFASV